MAYLELMADEEIIYETIDKITLTTHRIRAIESTFERKEVVSIMLEKISSISISSRNYLIFLILGVLMFLYSLWGFVKTDNTSLDIFIFVLGLIFIIVFALTRKSVVIISSDGGHSVFFSTLGFSHESIMSIINKIEIAKNNRMRYLSK